MPTEYPNPFPYSAQGVVPASGILELKFGPPYDQMWSVSQVSARMNSAPAATSVEIRYMNMFVDSIQAGTGTAANDPPIFLNGGETMSVIWRFASPGLIGEVLAFYNKSTYQ